MSRKAVISGREALPPAFTYTQARAAGISAERLYAYRAKGLIDQIARGLYRWADAPDIDQDLPEIAHRAPRGMLCLVTALARYGLTDIIPARIDIALPRGSRIPALRETIDVHIFARETFDLGREELAVGDERSVGIYSPERIRFGPSPSMSVCRGSLMVYFKCGAIRWKWCSPRKSQRQLSEAPPTHGGAISWTCMRWLCGIR
jgi:hypothetical protein